MPSNPNDKRFIRDLLLLPLLTLGAMLIIIWVAGWFLREEIALGQLELMARKSHENFAEIFHPVRQTLLIAKGWGEKKELDIEDTNALASRFIPVLDNLEKVSALVFADSSGRSFYLSKDGENWLSRSIRKPGNAEWQLWSSSLEILKKWSEKDEYDPRTRPWFKGATQTIGDDKVFWSKVYAFHTLKTPGITATVNWLNPSDKERNYTLGFDLPMGDILKGLSEIKVSDHGNAFLAEADGSVIAPSTSKNGSDPFVSLSPEQFYSTPVLQAVKTWVNADRPPLQTLSFDADGRWWTRLQPLPTTNDRIWLGIVVPEMDFLAVLKRQWLVVLVSGVIALALGVLFSLILSRKWKTKLNSLPQFVGDTSEFDQKVMALTRYGEGPNIEFKSTLRANLKTGKPGKEIEIAWLKGIVGFLNTDGGILLIGVDDEGQVLGLEADGFPNDDKCLLHYKNLVNQHIGAEYSKYLNALLGLVSGKQVLVVVCERADEPAFLTTGKNTEEFYIRSGPSSMKLTPRQMLQYLQVR